MTYYTTEIFQKSDLEKITADVRFSHYPKIFDNKRLVDTAGFVPLTVRIKQMLLSGEQQKINSEMFDSDDWRYMFENVQDNALEVGDDVEDVALKLRNVVARRNELLAKKGLLSTVESVDREDSEAVADENVSSTATTKEEPKADEKS